MADTEIKKILETIKTIAKSKDEVKKRRGDFVYNVRDVLSIRELTETSCERFSDRTAFLYHDGDGISEISYKRLGEDIRAFSTYLCSLGLENKTVAVIGKNSYAWALTYLAVCSGTGVILPLDRDLNTEQIEYLMNDSGASAVFYSPEQEKKFENRSGGVIYLCSTELDEYISAGKRLIDGGDRSYENHRTDPFSLGILLYTSGTTGVSKGVMLSQYNICCNIIHVMRRVSVSPEDRVISVLPLHHTYECMSGFLTMIYSGASIAYNDSLRALQNDFTVFKPTILIGVPILIEKLYYMIIKKYGNIKGGKTVLAWQKAMASGVKNEEARLKIFKSVNTAFGGKLRRILCGAASLKPEVYHGYETFGYKVYIGYGLTETSPVCIMHNDFYRSPDDIGFPLAGVSAMISEPNEEGIGELAVKGPNVMLGYYKNPEATALVIRDGWFYTGDLAMVTETGAYKIVGRKKSMIVSQSGKKIFPEELEYYLEQSGLVAECMVFGDDTDGDPVVTAAVYPDAEAVDAELIKRGITASGEEKEAAVMKLMEELISGINAKFPSYKAIRKIIIRTDEFEKTTTHKIKRTVEENRKGHEV